MPSRTTSQSTRRNVAPQHDLPSLNIYGCIPPLFPTGRIPALVAQSAAPPSRVFPINPIPISRLHRSSLRTARAPMAARAAPKRTRPSTAPLTSAEIFLPAWCCSYCDSCVTHSYPSQEELQARAGRSCDTALTTAVSAAGSSYQIGRAHV